MKLGRSERQTMRPLWSYGVDGVAAPTRARGWAARCCSTCSIGLVGAAAAERPEARTFAFRFHFGERLGKRYPKLVRFFEFVAGLLVSRSLILAHFLELRGHLLAVLFECASFDLNVIEPN
jgi:hypothetical protein